MSTIPPADLLTSLRWRYATKLFDTERTIPNDLWQTLEEALVLAPSSFGLQPWKFIVITDPAVKQSLVEHSWNQSQVADCSHYLVFAAPTQLGEAEIDTFLQLTATTRNVPLDTLEGYRGVLTGFVGNLNEAERITWASKQIYLALGQILTSAATLGIDTCPMEGIVPAEYDRVLGLPEHHLTTTVACAFGYRSAEDKYASLPKVRYSAEEVIERV